MQRTNVENIKNIIFSPYNLTKQMAFEHYFPVILATLAVLILGCANPKWMRAKDAAKNPSMYPSYLWLAFFALVVGVLACYFMHGPGKNLM